MNSYVQMLAATATVRKGQGLVEYMLILMLISTVALVIMGYVGDQLGPGFELALNAFP